MTGFDSKRKAAQDKLEQWGCEAFNNWWDSDYDDSTNPYEKDTFAYWAWAGWQAALAQPAQEPPDWFPAVENILKEYGLQAISFVADFKKAMQDVEQSQPAQEPTLQERLATAQADWSKAYTVWDKGPITRVCPIKDSVCGEREVSWCAECPKRKAQPVQEPVAWMRPSEEGYDSAFRDHRTVMICTGNPWTGWIPLYTAPPQRTWIGLTDDQINQCGNALQWGWQFARAIEAKSKEINNG